MFQNQNSDMTAQTLDKSEDGLMTKKGINLDVQETDTFFLKDTKGSIVEDVGTVYDTSVDNNSQIKQ